jgi:hypothetical protein
LSEFQSQSEYGREENIPAPAGNQNLVIQPIAKIWMKKLWWVENFEVKIKV